MGKCHVPVKGSKLTCRVFAMGSSISQACVLAQTRDLEWEVLIGMFCFFLGSWLGNCYSAVTEDSAHGPRNLP